MVRLIQKSGYIKSQGSGGYLQYIATREGVQPPGYLRYMAQRRGSHGLFGAEEGVSLKEAVAQAENHDGPIWTFIFSLRREDASRLGYDNADAWRQLLIAQQPAIADAMGIPLSNFHWYAAFHDADAHPHIHMVVWSDLHKQGQLSKECLLSMRSRLTNVIFQDEMLQLYQEKDLAYQELTATARATMEKLVTRMEQANGDAPELASRLLTLAQALETVNGKKKYGYLPKPVKALVDDVVKALSQQPEVAECYEVWNQLRDDLEAYYKDTPRLRLPLSKQKEFRVINNMVIEEAEKLRLELNDIPDTQSTSEVRTPKHEEPALLSAVARLLHHMGRIFRDNALPPPNPAVTLRIDSKRRKQLLEKRMALGHKADDHENTLQMQ